MKEKLIKIADVLDAKGLHKEARVIDSILATESKRTLEGLVLVADSLDKKGLYKEADYVDSIVRNLFH